MSGYTRAAPRTRMSPRPVGTLTTHFLDWAATKLAALGRWVWLLVWGNASRPRSRQVRTWIRTYNRQVKRSGQGVRILVRFLPTKSPRLNPIEPRWLHTRRLVLEPDRILSATELEHPVCVAMGSRLQPRLSIPELVS